MGKACRSILNLILNPQDFYFLGKNKVKVYEAPVKTREKLRGRVILRFNTLYFLEIRRATVQCAENKLLKKLRKVK